MQDYVICLILDISLPILDRDNDCDNDKDKNDSSEADSDDDHKLNSLDHSSILSISIVSIHKYPINDQLSFFDSVLL